MKLGFIGTGALSSAIVTGLKSLPGETTPVVLSPRNEEIAAGLAARFPDVRVAADNQAVLDDCDTVMLAVRPQIAREVLPLLRFRPDHHVVSLIATFSCNEIAAMVGPVKRVTKALPMPMIGIRRGRRSFSRRIRKWQRFSAGSARRSRLKARASSMC